MRIAVIGTGISGLVAARELSRDHEVDVFEAASYVGGHTNTVDVVEGDRKLAVDTGFIVFNERTYPNFCRLLRELGVEQRTSDMSFSVRNERSGLEYNGTDLNGLFAQRRNLLRPSFWRMVRDILRFYREAREVLETPDDDLLLGDFLRARGYSRGFVEDHLIPMGAAVWSSTAEGMRRFPLRFLVQFFENHGFLQVDDRPDWLTVVGGSRSYVAPLIEPFRDRVRHDTPVREVRREPRGVRVTTASGEQHLYDRVVLATHSDTSLRMLADASPLEREVLGAFNYQPNEAILHTDRGVMPRLRRAWASWNYHVMDPPAELPTVTYWMNLLQGLESEQDYFVTLNRDDVDPAKVLRRISYSHPVFTAGAVAAQARHAEVDGADRVHFCGAYWGYGFHEDGVKSGLVVAERVAALAEEAAA
ncbi:MAG: FAD-dependent oxidoreductase [Planctomycetes bacterium]|nr:FAD-dependent oxidoreductase [Planctomycetota bacterium]